MKKVPNLFTRDENKRITQEINPISQWVVDGEGVATRKYDGTCCLVKDGELYRRYTLRHPKPAPDGFLSVDYDPITNKNYGWVKVDFDDNNSKWHVKSWLESDGQLEDGTYELIGPKFQANPERVEEQKFVKHGELVLDDLPSAINHATMKEYLKGKDTEGIVWHHKDGRAYGKMQAL